MRAPRLSSLVSLALIGLVALVGCRESGDFVDFDASDFNYSPAVLNFQQVATGSTLTSNITLFNNGDREIRLDSLELTAPDGANADAFTILNPWEDGSYVLPGQDTVQIQVEYAPSESLQYRGLISFGTNIPDQPLVEIAVNAATPRPEIVVPERVTFTRTAPGSTDYQLLEVSNVGFAPLVIDDVSISGDSEFSIAFPGVNPADLDLDTDAPPESVDPNDSFFVRVFFEAVDDEFRSAVLSIASNDPNRPNTVVAVTANSNAPCLELEESTVDFGLSSIGNTSRRTVTLRNCSDVADTVITAIEIEDDQEEVFNVVQSSLPGQLQDGNNAVLGPRSAVSFLLGYSPVEERTDEATLVVRSNDAARPNLRADIVGQGSNFECPIAVARGRVRDTLAWQSDFIPAVPLDEIEFSADESFDPDGTNLSYEWTLVDRPPSSGAFFTPNNTVASPNLFLDIAGRYVVELVVYDGHGLMACDPSQLIIEAAPDSDIHVELTWNVAASPSGTGVDMDLHYLHENGQWGMGSPWEIFFGNTSEDWGNDGTVSLDIDDLTGAEPENINHNNPGGSPGNPRTYSAGVYYFSNSSGYPNADVMMRVYLSGQLVREIETRLFEAGGFGGTGDFWWAVNIPWDGVTLDVEDVNVIYEGGFTEANAGGGSL